MTDLGTAAAWDQFIFGANEEYSSGCSPLKLSCIMVVPCVFLFKPHIQGRICLNTMEAGGQTLASKTFYLLGTLPYSVSTIGPMVYK